MIKFVVTSTECMSMLIVDNQDSSRTCIAHDWTRDSAKENMYIDRSFGDRSFTKCKCLKDKIAV